MSDQCHSSALSFLPFFPIETSRSLVVEVVVVLCVYVCVFYSLRVRGSAFCNCVYVSMFFCPTFPQQMRKQNHINQSVRRSDHQNVSCRSGKSELNHETCRAKVMLLSLWLPHKAILPHIHIHIQALSSCVNANSFHSSSLQ